MRQYQTPLLERTAEPTQREIHDVQRYCTKSWKNAHLPIGTWEDATQEVLMRLIQTVDEQGWKMIHTKGTEPHRELVRAIDMTTKRIQRAKDVGHLSHEPAARVDTGTAAWKELEELIVSTPNLTARQQIILRMEVDGWKASEIADFLYLPTARVSDERYKAVRKLQKLFQAKAS